MLGEMLGLGCRQPRSQAYLIGSLFQPLQQLQSESVLRHVCHVCSVFGRRTGRYSLLVNRDRALVWKKSHLAGHLFPGARQAR
jgi:hypothetical protein